ncbi:MAG: type I secretion system permease/ATPase [Mesorhizobium sp.]|nr:MAG: type I secretion system permease/ATPase [Mesorhizobium sp.]
MPSPPVSARRPAERMLAQAGYGIGLIALLSGGVNALVLISPIYMLQIYDRVLQTYRVETLLYLSLIAVACVVVLGIFDSLRGMAASRLGRWWDETARSDIFDAALSASRLKGSNAAASMHDLQQVRSFVGSPSMLPFFDAPWTPVFLGLIFLLHPVLGLLGVFSALVLLCFALANDLFSHTAQARLGGKPAANSVFVATAMRNSDVVHAMGMQPAVVRLHERHQDEINAISQQAGERSALVLGASKAVRIGVQIAVLGIGAYLVTLGELTAGGMIGASIVLGRALAPIEQGIGSWRSFTAAREANSRIKILLRSGQPFVEPTALPPPAGKVSVENLSLVLQGHDRPVLRQVSFVLEPGSVLAIVGPSAAGKSTLCRVLVGSWRPSTGHVRIDGAALEHWRTEDRNRHMGYLPQSIELFGGTVRQNIARLGDASDAEVVKAAQRAGCHDMILRLTKGYDTEIGEGGIFLSGGQRQRIALARALLGNPRVVVLDEPNSNLDQEGESTLIAAIAEIKQAGATVVLVSHRFAMMRVVDMIAFLRDGVLEKFGPRDQMLEELRAVPAQVGKKVAGVGEARKAAV